MKESVERAMTETETLRRALPDGINVVSEEAESRTRVVLIQSDDTDLGFSRIFEEVQARFRSDPFRAGRQFGIFTDYELTHNETEIERMIRADDARAQALDAALRSVVSTRRPASRRYRRR